MKIKKISDINLEQVKNCTLEALISASGYESRARAIAMDLKKIPRSTVRFAWGFSEYTDDPIRKKNDETFKQLGFMIRVISSSDANSPEEWMSDLLKYNIHKPISLVVDISAMSRTWYGGIIKALSKGSHPFPVRTIFAYTPPLWSDNFRTTPANEVLEPMLGYASHALPNKPTALVLGLGMHRERALGLNDYLDPQITFCFYSSPGADPRYEHAVQNANNDLFDIINKDYIFTYDLYDTFGSFIKLESICQGLARNYRVVLTSLGPKIFGLYCLLIQTRLQEVSVWRVSPATRQPPVDHKPNKQKIFVAVDWE